MDRVNLDAVEARVDAATAGPWWQSGAPWFDVGWYVLAYSEDPHVGHLLANLEPDFTDVREEQIPDSERVANAAFIAHARTDVPAMAAELRAARKVVEAARRVKGVFTADGPLARALDAYDHPGRAAAGRRPA